MQDKLNASGVYQVQCFDADGNLKWEDEIENTVTTAGKNAALDAFFAGSSYTGAFYMGLISSASYSAISASDTMSSHAGWLEAGSGNAPTYTSPREDARMVSRVVGQQGIVGRADLCDHRHRHCQGRILGRFCQRYFDDPEYCRHAILGWTL